MMQTIGEDLTLHEGVLATEFGVSRTPIRQVLQKLAYERLVETRSGVGTIVSPLDPDRRTRDTQVLRAMFLAAASCSEGMAVPVTTHERLVAAAAVAEVVDVCDKSYLDIRADILDISADAAPDTILGDALRAAHWRHVRWRMADRAWEEVGTFDRLRETLRAGAAAARAGELAEIYKRLAEADL